MLPSSIVLFCVVASFPPHFGGRLVFSFVLAQIKPFTDASTSKNNFAKVYGGEKEYLIQDPPWIGSDRFGFQANCCTCLPNWVDLITSAALREPENCKSIDHV